MPLGGLLIAGVGAGLGGAAAVGKMASDADKIEFDNTPFYGTDYYDPTQHLYGGYAGGANDAMMRQYGFQNEQMGYDEAFRKAAMEAQQRQLTNDPRLDMYQNASRAENQGAVDLARGAAMGEAPSEAAYMMQAGLNSAMNNQQGLAAGARGAAAIANAQGNAMDNTAAMQQQAYTEAGRLRAQEMAQARGMYGTMANQLGGLDAQRQAQYYQNQLANRQSNDQMTGQYLQAAQNRAQLANQYNQQGMSVQDRQLQANMQNQDMMAAQHSNAQAANYQKAVANTKAVADRWNAAGGQAGAISQTGTGMASSLTKGV